MIKSDASEGDVRLSLTARKRQRPSPRCTSESSQTPGVASDFRKSRQRGSRSAAPKSSRSAVASHRCFSQKLCHFGFRNITRPSTAKTAKPSCIASNRVSSNAYNELSSACSCRSRLTFQCKSPVEGRISARRAAGKLSFLMSSAVLRAICSCRRPCVRPRSTRTRFCNCASGPANRATHKNGPSSTRICIQAKTK